MIESPFIEGTNIQFAWDSTTLGDWKMCPQYYYLTRIEGWQPNEESVHLTFGSLFQEALVNYELCIAGGLRHDDAVHDVVRALLEDSLDWWEEGELGLMRGSAKVKTRELLLKSVIWHLENYRDSPAKTHILANGEPAVELSFRFELDWGVEDQPYMLCGHLDQVIEFAGDLYVLDNKTSGLGVNQWYFDQFEPENQMSLYSLAANVLLDAPVKGVIIDATGLKDGNIAFRRGMTMRTQDQLDEWVDELRDWFADQERSAITNRWRHNDKACSMYGGCRFREVCSKSPSVRERFLEASFTQLPKEDRWNPLKSRRLTSSIQRLSQLRKRREQSQEERLATTSS